MLTRCPRATRALVWRTRVWLPPGHAQNAVDQVGDGESFPVESLRGWVLDAGFGPGGGLDGHGRRLNLFHAVERWMVQHNAGKKEVVLFPGVGEHGIAMLAIEKKRVGNADPLPPFFDAPDPEIPVFVPLPHARVVSSHRLEDRTADQGADTADVVAVDHGFGVKGGETEYRVQIPEMGDVGIGKPRLGNAFQGPDAFFHKGRRQAVVGVQGKPVAPL